MLGIAGLPLVLGKKPSSGGGGTTLSTILGSDLALWYFNHTSTGTHTIWDDDINNINIDESVTNAPPTLSSTTSGNVAWTFSGTQQLEAPSNITTTVLSGQASNRTMLGCIFKATGTPTSASDGNIISLVDNSGSAGQLMWIRVRNDGFIEAGMQASDSTFAIPNTNASVVDSTWHRVMMVWDGQFGTIYLDGTAQTFVDNTTAGQHMVADTIGPAVGLRADQSFIGSVASVFFARNASGNTYSSATIGQVDTYLQSLV